MTKYTVLIEEGATSFGASVPDLPGCFAVGETRGQVEALISDAVSEHVQELHRSGQPVPPPRTSTTSIAV